MCQYLYAASRRGRARKKASPRPSSQRWSNGERRSPTLRTKRVYRPCLGAERAVGRRGDPDFAANLPHPAGHYRRCRADPLTIWGCCSERLHVPRAPRRHETWGRPTLAATERPPDGGGRIVPRLQDFGPSATSTAPSKRASNTCRRSTENVGCSSDYRTHRRTGTTSAGRRGGRRRRFGTTRDPHDPRAGEGPRGHWRKAHFGSFGEILDEFDELRRSNPRFDPVPRCPGEGQTAGGRPCPL